VFGQRIEVVQKLHSEYAGNKETKKQEQHKNKTENNNNNNNNNSSNTAPTKYTLALHSID
jgi:hypothetical protein